MRNLPAVLLESTRGLSLLSLFFFISFFITHTHKKAEVVAIFNTHTHMYQNNYQTVFLTHPVDLETLPSSVLMNEWGKGTLPEFVEDKSKVDDHFLTRFDTSPKHGFETPESRAALER